MGSRIIFIINSGRPETFTTPKFSQGMSLCLRFLSYSSIKLSCVLHSDSYISQCFIILNSISFSLFLLVFKLLACLIAFCRTNT